MATYQPPSDNLAIFDPSVFSSNTQSLTIEEASKIFLKYPVAQGAETIAQLTSVNIDADDIDALDTTSTLLTATNANITTLLTTPTLNLNSISNNTIETTTTSVPVNLFPTTRTGAINIGTGANNSSGGLAIYTGTNTTGSVAIATGSGSKNINIAPFNTGTGTITTNIGGTSLNLGGTICSALTLRTAPTGAIQIGSATTTGSIGLGTAMTTGSINMGTATSTINLLGLATISDIATDDITATDIITGNLTSTALITANDIDTTDLTATNLITTNNLTATTQIKTPDVESLGLSTGDLGLGLHNQTGTIRIGTHFNRSGSIRIGDSSQVANSIIIGSTFSPNQTSIILNGSTQITQPNYIFNTMPSSQLGNTITYSPALYTATSTPTNIQNITFPSRGVWLVVVGSSWTSQGASTIISKQLTISAISGSGGAGAGVGIGLDYHDNSTDVATSATIRQQLSHSGVVQISGVVPSNAFCNVSANISSGLNLQIQVEISITKIA